MKKTVLLFTLLFIVLLSYSQSILWKISGKNMKEPSYLYGTVHIQDKRVFAFDSTVLDALESCQSFAMEILFEKITKEEISNAMYMKNNSLDKIYTKEEYYIIDSLIKKRTGRGIKMYNKMKPFFIFGTIFNSEQSKDMELPLDLYLLDIAKSKNKPYYQVEEFSKQVKAIDKLGVEIQAKMLYEFLMDTIYTNEEGINIDELLTAYLTFDLEKLTENSEDETDLFSMELGKTMNTNRNKVMVKNLIKIIKKQSCFCAIGAAHLSGEDGLIEKLRKSGYIVEPVVFNWLNQPIKLN